MADIIPIDYLLIAKKLFPDTVDELLIGHPDRWILKVGYNVFFYPSREAARKERKSLLGPFIFPSYKRKIAYKIVDLEKHLCPTS